MIFFSFLFSDNYYSQSAFIPTSVFELHNAPGNRVVPTDYYSIVASVVDNRLKCFFLTADQDSWSFGLRPL